MKKSIIVKKVTLFILSIIIVTGVVYAMPKSDLYAPGKLTFDRWNTLMEHISPIYNEVNGLRIEKKVIIIGKVTSKSTVSTDTGTTLATKDYVDGYNN